MYNFENIKNEALLHAEVLFKHLDRKKHAYHNWKHTRYVHNAAQQIYEGTPGLTHEEKENIELASIFHDTGFVETRKEHEEVSARLVDQFLSKTTFPSERIAVIQNIIRATRMGSKPNNIQEEIIQDADLSHLGSKNYIDIAFWKLYDELIANEYPELSIQEWKEKCIEFLRGHTFNTTYAKTHFNPIKKENEKAIMTIENKPLEKKTKKKNLKDSIPEKGIETMFRVSLRNHVNLSRIADNKANTLISINAIIISIILSTLFPKLDSNPYLIYPGITFLVISIITIVISILSVIPKTTHGKITKEQVKDKKGNLLFFGNFHAMNLEDFEWGVDELMKDRDYLYRSLTRDLFFLGKVLNRKYRFLRIAYYIFITGLVISISLFILSLS